MDLSLRTIVHTRYGLARGFSIRHDVLSKLDPSVNYRTADGKVSLRLILTPPLKPKIVSFSAQTAGPGGTNPVTFAWHVEPPTLWLKGNTDVTLLGKINVGDTQPYWSSDVGKNGHGLTGTTSQTFVTTTYAFELSAYVKVQGGTDGLTTPPEYVELNPTPAPVQAATLNGDYTVGYTSSRDPVPFTLTLSGTLVSAQGAAVGQTSFSQTMNLQLPPGGDVLSLTPAIQTIPFTVPNLRAGTWTVTATSNLAGSAECSGVSIPPRYLRINGNLPDIPTCQ